MLEVAAQAVLQPVSQPVEMVVQAAVEMAATKIIHLRLKVERPILAAVVVVVDMIATGTQAVTAVQVS